MRRRLHFSVSLQFLLTMTLLVAFFFLGWSTHQRVVNEQYQRDQFTAKKLRDQWIDETEMIRRNTSSRSARSVLTGERSVRIREAAKEVP